MAQPLVIHSSYAGMTQDAARDQLPAGALWNLIDYVPNALGAPLRKRGGFVYASSAISTGTTIAQVAYGLMDTGGAKLLAVDDHGSNPQLFSINETTGAKTVIGSMSCTVANALPGKPAYYGKQIFIPLGYTDSFVSGGPTAATSASACVVYDGSTMTKVFVSSAASGGAYGCRYAAVYKNRVMLANTPVIPRRIWFSNAGDRKSTRFTDDHAWLDVPMQITGLCALPNVLLVFGGDRTVRIRGSIPPPESDFIVDTLSNEGCPDNRAVAEWAGKCLYANTNGIFLTDGINTIDLTLTAGLSNYYRTLLSGFTSSWKLCGGVFRNYYLLSIVNASGTFQDCLVCDLRTRSFFRFSNMNFNGFTVGTGAGLQQWYAASAATNRVVRLTDMFTPASTNKADADGTSILPVVEYPCRRGYFQQGRKWLPTQGLTQWKRLYLGYDLRDAASDNPTLQMSYVTTPEASSYTTLADTLAETTAFTRKPFDFAAVGERGGKQAAALGLKVAQTAASSDTRLYDLEAEMWAIEGSRVS